MMNFLKKYSATTLMVLLSLSLIADTFLNYIDIKNTIINICFSLIFLVFSKF